jgi:predicted HTH transcriptional regulator
MGVEMVAFSNTQGGTLIIGVDDKTGAISGLSFDEIQQTNALLVNAASKNVKPSIIITTETVNIDSQNIIIAAIPKGKDKPYKDNKGIIWVKNGSDKRKVFSNAELRVMMQSCGNLSADSDSVAGTSYKDISEPTLKNYLFKHYTEELTNAGIFGHLVQSTEMEDIVLAIDTNFTIEKLLKNISLMDAAGQLTLSGLLLLGKSIQRYRPVFTIKGVSFVGNSVATTEFRDKLPDREVEGNLLKQYETSISFINRNLKTVQVEKEFNSSGQLEIPLEVFVETLTNALIHRDYYVNSPIRLRKKLSGKASPFPAISCCLTMPSTWYLTPVSVAVFCER